MGRRPERSSDNSALAALAVKIELIVEHEVATLADGEACLAALRRDALRLSSEQARRA